MTWEITTGFVSLVMLRGWQSYINQKFKPTYSDKNKDFEHDVMIELDSLKSQLTALSLQLGFESKR